MFYAIKTKATKERRREILRKIAMSEANYKGVLLGRCKS